MKKHMLIIYIFQIVLIRHIQLLFIIVLMKIKLKIKKVLIISLLEKQIPNII